MRIAICQINTTVADFHGNAAKVFKGLDWAKKRKAQLVVFPELTTFGYPPRDLLDKPYLIEKNIEAAKKIAARTTKNLGCVFGFVDRNPNPIGRGLLNSVALAFSGKIQHTQAKTLLPTYDVFDEARHFDAALSHQPILFQNRSLGLTVCEDIWADYDFDGRRPYALDPVALQKAHGAQMLINISASPFHAGKQSLRRQLLIDTAKKNQLPVIYCNLVGGNDELIYDGRSLAVDSEGKILWEGKAFQEEFALIDLDRKPPPPRLETVPEIQEVHDALILGLKDYLKKCHFSQVVVGLSGGVDSSVVACLAAKALGPSQVLGLSMPSPYSSPGSLKDARILAKRLGIDYRVVPIHSIYTEYLKTLRLDIRRGVSLAAENIQARIRGNILMAISNQQPGALVLSTGNKSELACGYCTLYGDLAGGLALLSDLPKTQVYELARYINRRRPIIPDSVLKKPPSAELKPNQQDQDSLPPYKMLDGILQAYIEEHLSPKEIVKKGFPKKVAEGVIAWVDHNEYKRRQAPPGIRVTSKAFGIGRRFPIAWSYK